MRIQTDNKICAIIHLVILWFYEDSKLFEKKTFILFQFIIRIGCVIEEKNYDISGIIAFFLKNKSQDITKISGVA